MRHGISSAPVWSEPRYASGVSNVAFEVSDETLLALKLDDRSVGAELRLVAAVKFFELGRLSSGAAATLAGVPRVVFLAKLGELGAAAFRQTEAELAEDLAHA
jgi:predicted HTH domain antitoxin